MFTLEPRVIWEQQIMKLLGGEWNNGYAKYVVYNHILVL